MEQEYDPVNFLVGQVSRIEESWTTYAKEAFSMLNEFYRARYMLWGPSPVSIYTDHENLLYVLAPLEFCLNAPQYELAEVHRWAIHLSWLIFPIKRTECSKSLFADGLPRWGKGH